MAGLVTPRCHPRSGGPQATGRDDLMGPNPSLDFLTLVDVERLDGI